MELVHEIEEEVYKISLPETTNVLRRWGNEWNHCIGSYGFAMEDPNPNTFVGEVSNETTGEKIGCLYYKNGRLKQFFGHSDSAIENQDVFNYFANLRGEQKWK